MAAIKEIKIIRCIGFFMLFFLTACSCSTITLTAKASSSLNSVNHRSLPVMMRAYTLKDSREFNEATFRELWHGDKKALGDSLLTRQVFSLSPNTVRKVVIAKNPEANFIAVIALFRHPYRHWRVIQPMPLWWGPTIRAAGNNITIQ